MGSIKKILLFSFFVALLAIAFLSTSCKTDLKQIEKITKRDTLPTQSAFNIETLASEKGIVRYKVLSPRVDQYENGDPYIEFPEGMHIFFYDSLGRITSELTAGYGIKYDRKRMMEARKDVTVKSHVKKETINSEHLVWDQNEKKIYTNEFVTITTNDKVIYGDALVSDEKFEKWEITKSKGNIKIRDNDR